MSDDSDRDRRCLLFFPEFSTVLNAARWNGSTITGVIREAWDSGTLHNTAIRNRSKDNKFLQATNCHVSIIGHITQAELVALMPEHSEANGFANRFLHVYAERTKSLPDADRIDEIDFTRELAIIDEAMHFARQQGRIYRTDEATGLWRDRYYDELTQDVPGRIGKFLSRAAQHVFRLATILTVLDRQTHIGAAQLHAAYEMWKYCEASIYWAYSRFRYGTCAQRILYALTHEGSQTMSALNHVVLKRSFTASEIQDAITELGTAIVATRSRTKGAKRFTTVLSLRQ